MPTLSVKCSDSDLEFYRNILNNLSDDPIIENRNDALRYVFERFLESDKGEKPSRDYEAERVLNLVGCTFLKYDPLDGFVCNERFHKRKKSDELGYVPETVIKNCNDCKSGKEFMRQQNIMNQLTKENIKKLVTLHKSLSQLVTRGLDVKAYVCASRLFDEGIFISSADGKRLQCIYEDMEVVMIETHCMERINEKTLAPPCAYLIDLLVRGESMDLQDIAKEYSETLRQLPDQVEDISMPPKEVDSEIIDAIEPNEEDEDTQEYD